MEAATDQVVRRTLEGGLEQVEEASARYHRLSARLRGWDWRLRASAWRPLLQEVLDAEERVQDALQRIERRARQEGWAGDALALGATRTLVRERTRLETCVLARLSQLQVPAPPGLSEALAELGTHVDEPALPELRQGERVLLEGGPSRTWLRAAQFAAVGWFYSVFLAVLDLPLGGPAAALGLVALGAVATLVPVGLHVARVRRSGRYTLTSERLFWQPSPDVLHEVTLETVPLEDLRVHRRTGTVQLGAGLSLRSISHPEALAARVALFALPRTLGAPGTAAAGDAGHVCEAELRVPRLRRTRGAALVHPDGVVFLPRGTAGRAFAALVGAEPPVRIPEALLLDTLARAPMRVLEQVVASAGHASGAALWPREAVSAAVDASRPQRVLLRSGAARLACTLDVSEMHDAHRLLAAYRRG